MVGGKNEENRDSHESYICYICRYTISSLSHPNTAYPSEITLTEITLAGAGDTFAGAGVRCESGGAYA